MGRRGRKAAWYAAAGEPTVAREDLERRWRGRLSREPDLAALVTARGAAHEPFHRWLPFAQGFSPDLVRRFLGDIQISRTRSMAHPVFDPFAGSGTTVVECARQKIRALGLEALPSLVFLTRTKMAREFPPFPTLDDVAEWATVAERLSCDIHRVALMLAVGRQHTSQGRPNRGAAPLSRVLFSTVEMMREDLVHPVPQVNEIRQGDARDMADLADGSVGAILTSPPYLSRHDYLAIAEPYEMVHAYWYGRAARNGIDAVLLRAHPGVTPALLPDSPMTPAGDEAAQWLDALGEHRLAGMLRAYLADMHHVLAECARVLVAGGPAWIVVGGARLKGVYVPADLILAEVAEGMGLAVDGVRVARDLIASRRKFGGFGYVAPRESILVMRRV